MKTSFLAGALAALAIALPMARSHAQQPAALTAHAPIVLPGPAGGFDYMKADPRLHRVYASHPGAQSFAAIDTRSGKITVVGVGVEVNGIALDDRNRQVLIAGGGKKLFALDRKSLAVKATMDLPAEADDIELDAKTGLLYIDNDEGDRVWVVDPRAWKLTQTITIPRAPEFLVYDPVADRLYQNIKSTSQIVVIDPASNTVVDSWPTAPAVSPHGLAIDFRSHRLFIAGANGTLAALDEASGKPIADVAIAPRVDQIVFDPSLRRIYCASGSGAISVVQETAGGAVALGDIAVPRRAHTITVDPSTHDVWICYADDQHSYFERLSIKP